MDKHMHAHFRTLARSTTRYHDVRILDFTVHGLHATELFLFCLPDIMPVVTVVTWVRLQFEAHGSGSALTSALGSIHADKWDNLSCQSRTTVAGIGCESCGYQDR